MIERFFFKLWYESPLLKWFLWPLHLPFLLLVSLRCIYYQRIFQTKAKKVPVIIVGNITVGGSGKSPFTICLIELIQKHTALRPVILSRGYGASLSHFPHLIDQQDTAATVGDEPWMMAHRLGVPVVVDPDRSRGADWIIEHLSPDLIICDDGLQHYRLARDYEILVYDGHRRFGNGLVMPFGPLREPLNRTKVTDLQVEVLPPHINTSKHRFYCQLSADNLVAIGSGQEMPIDILTGQRVVAVSAIADNNKFIATVAKLFNLSQSKGFPDHYALSAEDFRFAENLPVIMTEKDAAKCQDFARDNWYFLRLAGQFSKELEAKLINDIQKLCLESKYE